jgi:hypothetical protein
MDRLEQELIAFGRELPWPPTPDLVARVQHAIRSDVRAGSPGRVWWARWLAPGLAALLALALAATAAIPAARSAVLRWLGITGVSVTQVKQLPPARAQGPLHLGNPTSLAAAQRSTPFRILVPRALGEPDQVLVRGTGASRAVTLVYRPRSELRRLPGVSSVGALLTEFRGASTPFIEKMVAEASSVRRTNVGGGTGWWLVNPHVVVVQYGHLGRGRVVAEPLRLVRGRVLIWERGELALRLESELALPDARRVGRSLR